MRHHKNRAFIESLERRQLLSAQLIQRLDFASPDLAAFNGNVYFGGSDSAHGREVWETDGTTGNTKLFMDVNPGIGDSNPSKFQVVGQSLYFVASANGMSSLWRTDGIAAHTQQLASPVGANSPLDPPLVLSTGANTFLYSPFDGIHSLPSFKTIVQGMAVQGLATTNEALYFAENTGKERLFRYDGTDSISIRSITSNKHFTNLTGAGANLFYTFPQTAVSSNLYTTTGGGVSMYLGSFQTVEKLTAVGSSIFFFGQSTTQADGVRLWKSDGTAKGTVPLKRIWNDSNLPDPQMIASGNGIFFSGEGNIGTGTELWHSDGSPNGTALVKDINPNDGGSDPQSFVPDGQGGADFLAAYVTSTQNPYSLYHTDGTAEGTKMTYGFNETPDEYGQIAPVGKYVVVSDESAMWSVDPNAALVSGYVLVGNDVTAGYTVFLDSNRNGLLDAGERSTMTDDLGAFQFPDIAPGNVQVRVVPIAPNQQFSTATEFTRKLQPGAEFSARFRAISDPRPGKITGHIFRDLNGNAQLDGPNESGQSGVLAWLDTNLNGTLDTGEPTTKSDSSGNFEFDDLVPDKTYDVQIQRSKKFDVEDLSLNEASPGPAATGTVTFAVKPTQHITGVLFDDRNEDGLQSSMEPGLAGRTIWASIEYNDINNIPTYTSFDTTTDANGEFSLYVPMGYKYYVDAQNIRGRRLTTQGFSDYSQPDGQASVSIGLTSKVNIFGTLFNDANLNNSLDEHDRNIAHRQVYLDLNRNGQLDAGESSVQSNGQGQFGFINYTAGAYVVRQVIPDHWIDESGSVEVNAKSGALVQVNLSSYQQSGIIVKLSDGNLPKAGFKFFLDLNSNGRLDKSEPSGVTSTKNGRASFSDLLPGTYVVRMVPVTGYRLEGDQFRILKLYGSQEPILNLVLTARATIQGHIFVDANHDGKFEASKEKSPIETVFLDSNHNGVRDFGEPLEIAVNKGTFQFTQLEPGTYWLTTSPDPDYILPGVQKITVTGDQEVDIDLPAQRNTPS
jgi:ELWxxDGT repeat protein